MRVIITGSRDWPSRQAVWADLDRLYTRWSRQPGKYADEFFDVSVGDCPTGADEFARQWCETRDIEPSVYVARWTALGRGAGPNRNSEMVNDGGDVCLAYIGVCDRKTCTRPRPHGSHGATDCAHKAKSAGIPVEAHMIGHTDSGLT